MWSGAATHNIYSGTPPPTQQQAQQPSQGQSQQKHDIFVGNLAFNTTEEQLHQAFSEIGRVLKVRMVTDIETGKPRGFAFVEFEDPQAALSAIRNMNEYELNGRRIRVNFSNSSHLEALAGKLGMDIPNNNTSASAPSAKQNQQSSGGGTQAVADALKGMSKGEMYDVVKRLKEIADRDADEARRILSGHPQLPEAILHLMSKLEMIQTPVPSAAATATLPTLAAPATAASTASVAAAASRDPRQRAADPRQARADPRARPPPPPPPPQFPPPPPTYGAPPPSTGGVGNLDPALVQQVMALTPEQISQLPPDKQRSILELRQQITGQR